MESALLLLLGIDIILSAIVLTLDKKITTLAEENKIFIEVLKELVSSQDSASQAINNQGDIISKILEIMVTNNFISLDSLRKIVDALPDTNMSGEQNEQKL